MSNDLSLIKLNDYMNKIFENRNKHKIKAIKAKMKHIKIVIKLDIIIYYH